MVRHYVSEMCHNCGHTGDYYVKPNQHVVSCEMCGDTMLLCSICEEEAGACGDCPYAKEMEEFDRKKGETEMKHVSYDEHVEKMNKYLADYLAERDDERWDCGYDCGNRDALDLVNRFLRYADPEEWQDGDMIDVLMDIDYDRLGKLVKEVETKHLEKRIFIGDEVEYDGMIYLVVDTYPDDWDVNLDKVLIMDWSGEVIHPTHIEKLKKTGRTYPEFDSLLTALWERNHELNKES